MRLDGSDFFCSTTFPVGKDPCTLVVGGWGGMVVGLSNVDHEDASENGTTKTMTFKNKRWYRVRSVRDRCRDRSLDRRPEDGRPAAERPPVRHPHRVRTEPAAGHFHLGAGRRCATFASVPSRRPKSRCREPTQRVRRRRLGDGKEISW